MCDDEDSGFELAYVNKVIIDEKRSPQGKGFTYELKRNRSGLSGRSQAGSGLGWCTSARAGSRLGYRDLGCHASGLLHTLELLRLGSASLGSPVARGGRI